jgi:hypothetical protein
LVESINKNNNRIIVYGAGMIGSIVVPYFFYKYNLCDRVDFYVDMNEHKQLTGINAYGYNFPVYNPDVLKNIDSNYVILLTNSKFSSILEYLESLENLDDVDIYIIPLIQIELARSALEISIDKYNDKQLIPKTIHYCWFGNIPIPEEIQRYINSWKKYCPDYKIVEWNDKNYNYLDIPYVREAHAVGKYSFVSDVARLEILYKYGGIYLDTDVELYRNLDELLYQKGFIGVEKWGNINSGGGCGAVPNHPMIKEMLDERINIPFILEDGSFNIETNGNYETKPFIRHGMRIDNSLQIINGMTVYPSMVFHPFDYMSGEEDRRKCTISKHIFSGSWMREQDKIERYLTEQKINIK